jgi:hypothetical protein
MLRIVQWCILHGHFYHRISHPIANSMVAAAGTSHASPDRRQEAGRRAERERDRGNLTTKCAPTARIGYQERMRLQTVRTWVDSLVDKKRASHVLGWQRAVDACIIINGLYVTGITSDVDFNF